MNDGGEDRFVLQVVPPNIFPAVLPFRLLSYIKVKAVLEAGGYSIVETFPSVGGEGDYWEFRGLIAINNADSRTKCNKDEPGDGTSTSAEENDTRSKAL